MRLVRLKVEGFGPLKGEWTFDPERLNLVVDDNERGKSSLIAAITAGLYGLDADRRTHRVITPQERWRPWSGGAYRLELEVEHEEERYVVRRDFERGTVEVWNGRGQEVTADFRQGKEDYSVGRHLFGLDAEEFEKCALVRQGELDQVVPGDERLRRASTLHARLENAADTRVGDTNASEALQVLEGALKRYTCAELEFTGTVDTAIQRLELKVGTLATELKTLEHDLERMSGPLEELARRGEEEQTVRKGLDRLELERRDAFATDLRRQLREHEERVAALEGLKAEATALDLAAGLPEGAEAELRETIARWEEAQRNLDALEARRREEQARERTALDAEEQGLKQYAACTAEDADHAVALAAEMRRIGDEDARLRTSVFNLRELLAGRGYEPERIQFLTARFGALDDEQQRLLRGQSELALAFQTEVATLEQTRTQSTESLRAIDGLRNARRMPGLILLALGVGATLGGIVVFGMQGPRSFGLGMLAIGAAMVVAGVGFLVTGARAREEDRETALRDLSDAQRRLNTLRGQRAESEIALAEMSRAMGYRDPVELVREWNEYARLLDESGPVMGAEQQIRALEQQKRQAFGEVASLLARVGGGSPDPATLERVAAGIRHLTAVRQRLEALDRSWSWIDEERRVAEAAATGLKERAVRVLQSAGLAYDPERPWSEHIVELSERLKSKSRHGTLVRDLIPQAERALRPAHEIEEVRKQLAAIETERPADAPPPAAAPRGAFEIDNEARLLREKLDALQKWRGDLRVAVEEVWRKFHAEHPERLAQKERAEQTLEGARRFKQAVELARETLQKVAVDTHRRWAEHLNHRVAELLKGVGTGVEEVRFGEDLDFSVRLAGGSQAARGKAVLALSSGARDQLHLAVRLAISEYLSRGQAGLPLLLDDALSTSDDERADALLRLLAEHFAKRHQILLVTCHKQRTEAFAGRHPDLWRDRVHRIELQSAGATR
jgi:DNA repair exonuclease SbcCD ATPase subunit